LGFLSHYSPKNSAQFTERKRIILELCRLLSLLMKRFMCYVFDTYFFREKLWESLPKIIHKDSLLMIGKRHLKKRDLKRLEEMLSMALFPLGSVLLGCNW